MDLFLIQIGYEHVTDSATARKKRLESQQFKAPSKHTKTHKVPEIVLKEEVEERANTSTSHTSASPMEPSPQPIEFEIAVSSEGRNTSPEGESAPASRVGTDIDIDPVPTTRAFYNDPSDFAILPDREGGLTPVGGGDRLAEPAPAPPEVHHKATGLVLSTLMASSRREGSQLALALLAARILPGACPEHSLDFSYERNRVLFYHHVCREVAMLVDSIKAGTKGGPCGKQVASWFCYDINREMRRQRLSEKWGISSANAYFTKCPTYPQLLVQPRDFCEDTGHKATPQLFNEIFNCRSIGRVKTLTYYNAFSGAAIVRCAQPLLLYANLREKEFAAYRKTALASPLVVFDLRPFTNAAANIMKFGAYEAARDGIEVRFCDIPNIKVVTSAYERLVAMCQLGAPRMQWYRDAATAHTSSAVYMAECDYEATLSLTSPSSPVVKVSPTASGSAFPLTQQGVPSSPALRMMRPPERLPSSAALDQLETGVAQPKRFMSGIASMLGVSAAPPNAAQQAVSDIRDGLAPFDVTNRKAVTAPSLAVKAIASTEWLDCLYLLLSAAVEVSLVVAGSTAYLHSPFLSHPVLSAILSEHEGAGKSCRSKSHRGLPAVPSDASLTSPPYGNIVRPSMASTPKGHALSGSLPNEDVFTSDTTTPSKTVSRYPPRAPSATGTPMMKGTTSRGGGSTPFGLSQPLPEGIDAALGNTATLSRASRANIILRSNFADMSDDTLKDYCDLVDTKLLSNGRRGSIAKEHFGKHAIVHCTDGWDRTSQVCALSQIMLDPYFRTIEGFCVLIEKDFISFGHQFRLRSDYYTRSSGDVDSQTSPIFLQFIDCIHQLLVLYPRSFEFSESFLLFILDVFHSGATGSFVANNMLEIVKYKLREETLSLWQLVSLIMTSSPFSKVPQEGEEVPAAACLSSDAAKYSGFLNEHYVCVTKLPRMPPCDKCAKRGHQYTDAREDLVYCAKHQAEDFKRLLLLRPAYSLTSPISPLAIRLWEGYFFRCGDSSNGRGLRAQLLHMRPNMSVHTLSKGMDSPPIGQQQSQSDRLRWEVPASPCSADDFSNDDPKGSQTLLLNSGEVQPSQPPPYTPSWSSVATPQTPVANKPSVTASLFPALPLSQLAAGIQILPTIAPAVNCGAKAVSSSVMAGFDDEWNA
eukprot:GILI01009722.1.p1 GENE.GILI01009722.1~~GILI01009722.1.p1  ORF type:complete len:1153 (+),score=228.33 GILI01009722.1:282-3740(+)